MTILPPPPLPIAPVASPHPWAVVVGLLLGLAIAFLLYRRRR